MKYIFEIHEKAIGKERPRYSSKTHRMYTPKRTSTFEEKVRSAFLEKYNIATEVSTKPFKAKIYMQRYNQQVKIIRLDMKNRHVRFITYKEALNRVEKILIKEVRI